jgi:hypothetical protein
MTGYSDPVRNSDIIFHAIHYIQYRPVPGNIRDEKDRGPAFRRLQELPSRRKEV